MDTSKITQAMIDAYDEYTHLTLDRRDFMRKLQGLAGSAAAAAAIAPLIAASSARASLISPDDTRLNTEDVTYRGAPGDIKAYMASPTGDETDKLPSVIVIHENRGLNEHIRDVARRLAVEGFLVIAPDLLSPSGGTPDDEDMARELISKLDPKLTVSNLIAAHKFLAEQPRSNGKVGAVGFCWGGGQANLLATTDENLSAAVVYYGAQPPSAEVANIHAAMLLHYAGLDERINKGIEDYKKALEDDGKKFQIFIYDNVNHAFNNDTAVARYNKEAADIAWKRTVDFLKEQLK